MADEIFSTAFQVSFQASAEINGARYPVVSVEITYALNRLATAQIGLAIGRVAGGPALTTPAATMTLLGTLRPFTPVKLYITAEATPSGRGSPKGDGFPSGEFLAFTGFLHAPAASRSSDGAVLFVEAMGATAGLAGATQMVAGLTTASVDTGNIAVVSSLGGDSESAVTAVDALRSAIDPEAAEDLWKDVLGEIFRTLIDTSSSWTPSVPITGFAQTALDRINTGDALPPALMSLDSFDVEDPNLFAQALSTLLVNRFYTEIWTSGMGTGDLWDALLAFSGDFAYMFVPAVEEDGVLPVCLGLGGEPYRTLDPDEYFTFQWQASTDQKFYSYLSAVGLVSPFFAFSPWETESPDAEPIGLAEINPVDGVGRLQLIQAPAWMYPPGPPGGPSLNPGGAIPDAANPETTAQPDHYAQNARNYLSGVTADDYAMAYLMNGLFAHRRMSVAGRFRMDIAPGSLLKIVTVGDVHTANGQNVLYGHVAGVTLHLGMQNGQPVAYTKFDLTNVRTEAEHAQFTVQEHPLYGVRWVGGSLIAGL